MNNESNILGTSLGHAGRILDNTPKFEANPQSASDEGLKRILAIRARNHKWQAEISRLCDPGTLENASFREWRLNILVQVLAHPAMQEDSTSVIEPDLDSFATKKGYDSGDSVQQTVSSAFARFDVYGW